MSTHEELLEIVKKAAGSGHQFEWDPPAGLTSMRGRWTCKWCGRAVIMRHDETCYGSAAGSDCVLRPKIGQVWESIDDWNAGSQVKILSMSEDESSFVAEVVRAPSGREAAYYRKVGQRKEIRRDRLQDPPAYKYGYKLVQDVTE